MNSVLSFAENNVLIFFAIFAALLLAGFVNMYTGAKNNRSFSSIVFLHVLIAGACSVSGLMFLIGLVIAIVRFCAH